MKENEFKKVQEQESKENNDTGPLVWVRNSVYFAAICIFLFITFISFLGGFEGCLALVIKEHYVVGNSSRFGRQMAG